ncbi:hypothetical protein NA57DRAFT_81161 [Rhizodiscina lignyota]|uniref:RRM domain-containing protein n=1 Tax=Rhizodiscina lignyota TaxID=1504668 RepID=A0A9P4I8F0_9PEZI|nr:hypothetical protein NA57DRAFT_81161 [Rhizodiscina lignyota]
MQNLSANYGWQQLKDEIRTFFPSKGPEPKFKVDSWDSKPFPNAEFSSREDAELVYRRLTQTGLALMRGQPLQVALLQTSHSVGGKARLLEANWQFNVSQPAAGREQTVYPSYASVSPQVAVNYATTYAGLTSQMPTSQTTVTAPAASYIQQPTSIPAYTANITTYTYATVPVASYDWTQATQPTLVPVVPVQVSQSYQHQLAFATAAQQPSYSMSSSTNLPVNTSSGTVLTESLGVFISELPWNMTERELKGIIKKIEKPKRCELQVHRSGRPKGTATASFDNVEQARRVIRHLNGREVGGKRLKVRFDREATTIRGEAQGPTVVIANGSNQ